MTHIEHSGSGGQRHHRTIRVLFGIAAPVFALMACYSLFKAVRGDTDSYPYENLRSFSSAGALALLMSREFVRSDRSRWIVLGCTFGLLALHIWLTHASAPVNWLTGVAALSIVIGVLIVARALWPARGTPREEWGAALVTPRQLRAVCVGMAVTTLGFALVLLSLVDFRGAPWDAVAVVALTTAMLVVGALTFLRLRRRIG